MEVAETGDVSRVEPTYSLTIMSRSKLVFFFLTFYDYFHFHINIHYGFLSVFDKNRPVNKDFINFLY